MNFIRLHFIPALFLLILLCSVFSCKKNEVTYQKEKVKEYDQNYSGILFYDTYMIGDSGIYTNTRDSLFTDITVQQFGDTVARKNDSIKISYPNLESGSGLIHAVFYFEKKTPNYVSYWGHNYGPSDYLYRYFSTDSIYINMWTPYSHGSGMSYSFSGIRTN